MTAAVAGRAAAGAGGAGRAAGGGAAARRPRARTIDERTERGGERFRERWGREGAGEKKTPRKRQPSSKGLMDAMAAGGEKPAKPDSAGGETPAKSSAPSVNVSMPGAVSSGAGFILAVLFWSWVALPFLKGGPAGVKNVLKAKFTNKAADGSWLP